MNKFKICPNEKFLSEVKPVVKKTLERCEKFLKPKRKYFVVISPTYDTFVKTEMGGSSGNTDDVGKNMFVSVNTENKEWKRSFIGSVSHEFNHIVRLQSAGKNFFKFSIAEMIALDGLAQCFEEDMSGYKAPYSNAITISEAKRLWKKIKSKLNNIDPYFYRKLFFGDYKSFPHWGGYTLSYLIVKKRKEELGLSWPELMKIDAKKLIGDGLD